MSAEVELVHEFMMLPEASAADDLRGARSILDDAIAFEARGTGDTNNLDLRRSHNRARRARWAIGVTVAAAAIAAVILQAVPSTTAPSAKAAAAEITRLADAAQRVPSLGPDQWYQYQLQGALSANVRSGTKSAPIDASATVPIAIGEWSNATGAACTSEQLGTATFADPTDAQAWQTMGLITMPANQPATGCSAGIGNSAGGGGTPLGPIDVSNITHDPDALATQLQDGTTGIGAIDNYAAGEQSQSLGFRRLTVLLVGPLKGQWLGFGQEMLETMAVIPGIESLGTMTSHSGAQGLAFSMPTEVTPNKNNGAQVYTFTPPTVILDAQNGTLLEVRDLDYPVLQSVAQDFVGSSTALVYADGVSYGVTAQWIDPHSGLEVTGQTSLPGWISKIHIIEAVTAPSTTQSQLSLLLNPLLGKGNEDAANDNVPRIGENTHDITIIGTLATAQSVANTLSTSGLFTSVSIKL